MGCARDGRSRPCDLRFAEPSKSRSPPHCWEPMIWSAYHRRSSRSPRRSRGPN